MKKQLLFIAALLAGGVSLAQMTADTEAEIGSGTTLYVIDSMAVSYEEITGDGVTWDYSQTTGYANATRLVTMLDPAGTANGFDFPNATHALEIEDFVTNYTSIEGDEKVTHGFTFSDPNFGQVVAVMDEPATVVAYPFDLGDVVTDDFTGTTDLPQIGPSSFAGNIRATIDGRGTLKLANGVEYEDVIRYKSQDTVVIDAMFFEVDLIRTQYEYYNFDESEFPLLMHSSMLLEGGGLGQLIDATLVLSSEQPDETVNVPTIDLAATVIYPNPVSDLLTIKLPQSPEAKTTASIVDALGRTVMTNELTTAQTSLSVSELRKGVYFVKINSGTNTTTQRIVVK